MRKIILAIFCLALPFWLIANTQASDKQEKIITYAQLPEKAQVFVTTHFTKVRANKCVLDTRWKKYDVKLNNGYEVEFDRNGDWTEIESRDEAFPVHLIGLLPLNAVEYLKKEFPQVGVSKICRLVAGYKVEMLTRPETEVKFDVDGKVISKKTDK